MSNLDKTVKCPICSKPYKFYAYMAGDQSACPSCVGEAEGGSEKGREYGDSTGCNELGEKQYKRYTDG